MNNGKSGAKLDLTSSTTPRLQIHKVDHTRTANSCGWLPCLPCLFISLSCWGTHFLYLSNSNPPSGNLLPIIPCYTPWTLSLSLSGGVVGVSVKGGIALPHLCEVDNCRVNLDLCCFLINAVFWGYFPPLLPPGVCMLSQLHYIYQTNPSADVI